MSNQSDSSYIPQITGIRAIAAFMVYVHHFPTGQEILPSALFRMTLELHTGVGLFFVLSGFLIYQRYYESCTFERSWWGNYTKNRVARIYPMYFLLTCATLLNRALRHGDAGVLLWILNLSFFRGFSNELYMSGISQGWTLTVEECFYFSAPVLFLLFRRVNFWLPLLGIYLIGVVLMAVGGIANGMGLNPMGFFEGFHFMATYTFFGRCFEFFAGMFLAKYMAERRLYAVPQERGRFTWIALSGIIGSLWLMSTLQSPEYRYGIQHPLGMVLNNVALPVCYALLFFGLVRERTVVQRFLATRFMVLLGKSSYIFYLIHMGVAQALIARVVCPATFTPVTTIQYIAQFVLLNVASIILFLCIEDPLNRLVRRIWKTGSAKPTFEAVS